MSLEEDYDEEVTALYRKCSGRVLGFLINMGCERGLAEEIMNDAFNVTWRRWADVRAFDEPAGYVFMVARNLRRNRQRVHDLRADDLHPAPPEALRDIPGEDPARRLADRAVVQQALRQLPPSQREAVVLRHVLDLSEASTAKIMGVSTGSVKRYAAEGRQRLRLLLAEFKSRRGGNDR